jgi:phosphoglycerate dehydrogenase-like enzyme
MATPPVSRPSPGPDRTGQRPLVIQTEQLDAEAHRWLAERCELVVCPWDASSPGGLHELLPRADGLLIRTYTRVDAALLDRAPRLRVVARAGVGLDNVDLSACAARGVTVVSTPGANTRAVVELVTAFMLDALRPRAFLDKSLDAPAWTKARKDLTAPRQLSDLTLGIIGLGRVGSGVARVGAALDMRVVYCDLLDIPAARRFGAEPASMDEVLSTADVISVHVDGRKRNRGLIDAAALARCKADAVLINTSRGMVVDAIALADYLIRNKGAQALLDVHEPEPFGPAYPLLDLPNAHLSPHIGAATLAAHANMSWVVRDLYRVLRGEAPEHPARPEPE